MQVMINPNVKLIFLITLRIRTR